MRSLNSSIECAKISFLKASFALRGFFVPILLKWSSLRSSKLRYSRYLKKVWTVFARILVYLCTGWCTSKLYLLIQVIIFPVEFKNWKQERAPRKAVFFWLRKIYLSGKQKFDVKQLKLKKSSTYVWQLINSPSNAIFGVLPLACCQLTRSITGSGF